MSLSKKIKRFITHQFIAVILHKEECHIRIDLKKNGKTLKENEVTFVPDKDMNLTSDMEEFFKNALKQYKHTYIGVLLPSAAQGAFKGCESERFSTFNIDINNVKRICIEGLWSVYASNIEINWIKNIFKNVDIDFIYSPFVILYSYIKEEKKEKGATIYILNEGKSLTIIIMKGEKFLYGAFFDLENRKEDVLEELEKEGDVEEDSIILDDLEADNMFKELEDLDEIADFEDLDNITPPDDLDIEEMLGGGLIESEYAKTIVDNIKSSMKDFYDNPLYESSFVEFAKIYEYESVDYKVVDYLENELLLDVEVKKVDILKRMNELSEEEILK
ncbi:MAG: hypothetical protein GXO31_00940 [Epsilonproteobacteria bacterium]|nr:hypothetical protein [Campylobacterota bacterium]